MPTCLSHLYKQRLHAVRHDVDAQHWVFNFSGGLVLQVSAAWRVLKGERVAVGWRDHGQLFGLAAPVDLPDRLRSLVGSGIVATATHDSAGDLAVQFENGSVLEVFNDSSGYEGWGLHGPGKRSVVAQGGGHVVESADG
ncbi:MAG: hypothetical protein HZB39_06215 [Planctomycetes bacterium]|nr:hypothetical protein [Planctomycetota bacterium]